MIQRLARSAAVRLLLSAAILAYLLSTLDASAAVAAMAAADVLWIGATCALVALDRLVMIWRWVLLLRSSGVHHVSLKSAAWIFLVSSFVGSFLPAGIGADAARGWTLSRREVSGSEAFASVAVDRLLGVVAIAVLGGIGMAAWSAREATALRPVAFGAAGFAVLSALAVFWLDRVVEPFAHGSWRDSRLGSKLFNLADAIGRYRGRPKTLAAVATLSIGVQVIRVMQAYCLGRSLGLAVSIAYYFVFMPVGLLMLLLPVSVSGFGLPQGVIVWMLTPAGVPAEQAFALSTLIVLAGLAGNLPGALLYVRSKST